MRTRKSSRLAIRSISIMSAGLIWLALTMGPASAQGLSVSYSGIEHTVKPGDTVKGSVRVTNASDQPKKLVAYQGDWVRVAGQSSGYMFDIEGGKEARSSLKWTTYSPDQMLLQPGETRDVNCEIKCPDDASLKGTYWSVIFVKVVPLEQPAKPPPTDKKMSVNITTEFRYAVQFFVTFEGTEIREANFSAMEFRQMEGGFDVIALFHNKGNTFLRPKVWLEIRNTSGETVYKQNHGPLPALPDSSMRYVFKLRNLPIESGTYLVMVLADYGVPDITAAQVSVELKAQAGAPAPK